jgi:acetolactate synthase-1/2/3 large subunit
VLVDLPVDVVRELGDPEYPASASIRGYNPIYRGHSGQIRKAAQALKQASRPLFYVGGGIHISGAAEVLRRIVGKSGVPVVSSLMGIGSLPGADPLDLGMLGMHGTYQANMAVSHCDLLFAVGTRFDDRATGDLSKFATGAQIVHIDIDPISISRNVPVAIPIVGDARTVLEQLEPLVEPPAILPWLERIRAWRQEHPPEARSAGPGLSPVEVIEAVCELFPEAIVSTEVGQNQMWTALFYKFRQSRSLLTSGGLGTMGYGFPAAIGAQLGNPGRKVIDIAGDGSIQMNIQELATAVQNGLPVIVAILNNGFLGMVRQWQELFYQHRYSSTCLRTGLDCPPGCPGPGPGVDCPAYTPDFVKLAEAYGAVGLRVTRSEEVRPALLEAGRSTRRPVLIDFIVQREFNVYPMVAPGAGIMEMML